MKLPLFQIDAFAGAVFSGNPAAVVPLERWLDDATMQKIATENNLSETAFFVGGKGRYHIRWMTPTSEVDLCGHATLASAWVVLHQLEPGLPEVRFESKSGPLTVRAQGDLLRMDFPARPPEPGVASSPALVEARGATPRVLHAARDLMAVFETEDEVRALRPDMGRLAKLPTFAVCVTAPGREPYDFVSRFFAPAKGVPEDPVTGSAHCTLIPYWSRRLGKKTLHARQVSPRGGELFCEDLGDRVAMAGSAALYLTGTIEV